MEPNFSLLALISDISTKQLLFVDNIHVGLNVFRQEGVNKKFGFYSAKETSGKHEATNNKYDYKIN